VSQKQLLLVAATLRSLVYGMRTVHSSASKGHYHAYSRLNLKQTRKVTNAMHVNVICLMLIVYAQETCVRNLHVSYPFLCIFSFTRQSNNMIDVPTAEQNAALLQANGKLKSLVGSYKKLMNLHQNITEENCTSY